MKYSIVKKPVGIQELLDLVDPGRIELEVGILHDKTREKYVLQTFIASNYRQALAEATKYYLYHSYHANGISKFNSWQEVLGEVRRILEKGFAAEGGRRYFYYISTTGLDGGVWEVVNRIYRVMREEAIERYIRGIFEAYVSPVFEERVTLAREYINRFGVKGLSPYELANNIESLILRHAQYVSSFRKMMYNP